MPDQRRIATVLDEHGENNQCLALHKEQGNRLSMQSGNRSQNDKAGMRNSSQRKVTKCKPVANLNYYKSVLNQVN